ARVADGGPRPICIPAGGIRFPEAHEPRRGGSPGPGPTRAGDREAIPSRRARSPWPLGRAADRERTALMATRPRRLKPSTPPARGRASTVSRQTKETSIELTLGLDGQGTAQVSTGVPFLDHMLELLAKHGHFDLTVAATGDLHIDQHHTVEDVGLVLGRALREALAAKAGIPPFAAPPVP